MYCKYLIIQSQITEGMPCFCVQAQKSLVKAKYNWRSLVLCLKCVSVLYIYISHWHNYTGFQLSRFLEYFWWVRILWSIFFVLLYRYNHRNMMEIYKCAYKKQTHQFIIEHVLCLLCVGYGWIDLTIYPPCMIHGFLCCTVIYVIVVLCQVKCTLSFGSY